jgi:hypothetical protein
MFETAAFQGVQPGEIGIALKTMDWSRSYVAPARAIFSTESSIEMEISSQN